MSCEQARVNPHNSIGLNFITSYLHCSTYLQAYACCVLEDTHSYIRDLVFALYTEFVYICTPPASREFSFFFCKQSKYPNCNSLRSVSSFAATQYIEAVECEYVLYRGAIRVFVVHHMRSCQHNFIRWLHVF